MSRTFRNKSPIEILCIGSFILIALILVGSIIASPSIAYGTKEEITVTVIKTERVVTKDSSKYLIFSDTEVLENSDSVWYWKWNSSDIYGKLSVGKTYKFTVYGWRVPFLSWYRNIIKYEEITLEE